MRSRIGSLMSPLAAALSASCCVLPTTLLVLGFASLGPFAVLMRYRPLTLSASFLMLAGALYAVYRPKAEADCAKGVCSPKALRRQRVIVWISAVLMIVFVALSQIPVSIAMSG